MEGQKKQGTSPYYLAVDIGASSGRHILGRLEDGKLVLEEVYRFANGMECRDGKRLWDLERLFAEIRAGMKRCGELGKIPAGMSIDTWAVDYALLDADGRTLGDTYGYRDGRTAGMDKKVYERIGEAELYRRTGIQKQPFNTIYQLMADRVNAPDILRRAKTLLMLPDYFQFRLTGRRASEYTNGTSTQLVNPRTGQWDLELIESLGYPAQIFLPLKQPGTVVGALTPEISREVGYDTTVRMCASHDTASAVMAVPQEMGACIYISSGTWSLMGTETTEAIVSEESRRANFTNEGGYDRRFRYLKNIMGLWMIQSVRHEYGDRWSFAELCDMAEENRGFPSRVDVNSDVFLAPERMIDAVLGYCAKSGQKKPQSPGEIAAVIYQSLADCYGATAREIEANTGRTYDAVRIIGGGSNAAYLNQLTADASGKTVYAGPGEATAVGNLLAQLIAVGELADLAEARRCVKDSFAIKTYRPKRSQKRRKEV